MPGLRRGDASGAWPAVGTGLRAAGKCPYARTRDSKLLFSVNEKGSFYTGIQCTPIIIVDYPNVDYPNLVEGQNLKL
ncbi:hypothetical protein M514_26258 [Trichuris suis]|uniref:Uncharacterized protein n=1 Tax=Trichuris suis TaxID=68888 RepID=A0A085MWH4_9BILA|nr:hypothetical protein M514_26258 [Trichuris suis]